MQLTDQTLDLDQFEDIPTATVDVVGPEHPARKRFHMDRARKMRAAFQRTGKVEVTDPLDDIDVETDFLVACTTGWENLTRSGSIVPYSADEARALYTDPKRQWVRSQVKKALDEADRFISNSVKA